MALREVSGGGFAYLEGGLAYSQGVVALPGYEIQHVRFLQPVPVSHGFSRIEKLLAERGRPPTALCGVELRSPKPLTIDGFREFNQKYAERLRGWGLVHGDLNAVARSNVAPVVHPPGAASFQGFSFTVRADSSPCTFVVSGSSEWPEGGRFPEDVVRFGATTADALREKAAYVLAAMERRMKALGVGWSEATLVQSYCAYDVFDFLSNELVPRSGAGGGIVLQYCRPPVVGWDYEMDVKGLRRFCVEG